MLFTCRSSIFTVCVADEQDDSEHEVHQGCRKHKLNERIDDIGNEIIDVCHRCKNYEDVLVGIAGADIVVSVPTPNVPWMSLTIPHTDAITARPTIPYIM